MDKTNTDAPSNARLIVLLTIATVLFAIPVMVSVTKPSQGVMVMILAQLLWIVPSALFWVYALRNADMKYSPRDKPGANLDNFFDSPANEIHTDAMAASGDSSSLINGIY